jgi:hypothetical protein
MPLSDGAARRGSVSNFWSWRSPSRLAWAISFSNWKRRCQATSLRLHFLALLSILPSMELSSLSASQLKELVRGLVDDRLRELIGDPDLGLELGEALRTRLKTSLEKGDRLSGDELAEKLGLRW